MPNGSLLKQNHPKGVMNVVSSLDSLAREICQNPPFASNLLKSFAPDSCARVVSTLDIGWTSRKTFSLSGLRSTQIRTAPESFGTTTIAAHQGVGSCTGDIIPILCIHCNSDCTFDLSGRGILRGALRANGLWLGLSLIVYACANFPSPVNKVGHCEMILFSIVHTCDNISSFLIAGKPSRLFSSL